jgi:hypothetical protein
MLRPAVFLCGVALLLMTFATPAWAARVIDIRMGQHPDFSRVVFELDSPVGYKVERRAPSDGRNELVVSLNASAQARTLRRKLKFIESLQVRSRAGRSTVHVRLRGEDLKLKEMILANPPRIVLDVLDGKAVAARSAVRARAERTERKVEKSKKVVEKVEKVEVEKVEKPVAKVVRKPAEPAATRTSTRALPPAPKPVVEKAPVPPAEPVTPRAKPEPEPEASKAEIAQPPASLPPGSDDVPSGSPQQLAMAQPPTPPSGTAALVQPAAPGSTGGSLEAPRPAPKPAARARPKPAPAEPAAMTAPSGGGLFSMRNITIAGVGVVLLGAAFVFVRRRNQAEVVDASAFESPLGDEVSFGSFDSEEGSDPIIDAPPVSEPSPAEEGADMESFSEDAGAAVSAPGAGPMGAQAAALGGADVARLVGDFERRVAAMEARIDELVEAKERLERQVAAQTEELRVQRAAIARTQRAVRNMSRPIDDSATEPAERDPSRPEGPRG